MRKEVRTVLRGLRQYADPPSSFEVCCLKNYEVSMHIFSRKDNEDMQRVIKLLQEFADPKNSFSIIEKNHFKVSWDMTNDDGERVTVRRKLPHNFGKRKTWKETHKKQLQHRFKELNISTEVNHI